MSGAYRPDIDGLRAVAIVSVVGFHAFPDLLPGGFIGVDIFFVISGFLITGILLAGMADGSFNFAAFYARRVRRIFPAMLLVMAACLMAGWYCLSPDEYAELGAQAAAGAAFASNFIFWSEAGYFDRAADLKPLLHLWSLGVEEQFYLLWPALLWLLASRPQVLVSLCLVVVGVSFAANLYLLWDYPDAAFYLLPSRLWELAAGALLACDAQRSGVSGQTGSGNWVAAAGAMLMGAGLLLIRPEYAFPGVWTLLPVVGACCLIHAGPAAALNRLLGRRLPVWLGLISFPLYLWHWPLLVFARLLKGETPAWEVRCLLVLAAVALAHVTYRWFEQPLRYRVRFRPLVAGAAVLMLGMGSAGLLLYFQHGAPGRFAPEIKAIFAGEHEAQWDVNVRTDVCHLNIEATHSAICAETRRPLLLLWGDSHAAALYPGLHQLQREQDFGLAQFTAGACPPLLDFVKSTRRNCAQVNRRVFDEVVVRLHPEIVVLGAYWRNGLYGLYDPATRSMDTAPLGAMVERLRANGVRRIVLAGPIPAWKEDLSRVVFRHAARDPLHRLPPPRLNEQLLDGMWEIDGILRAFASAHAIQYVSPASVLCNAEGCLTRLSADQMQLTAIDYAHFTSSASVYVVRALAPAIFGTAPAGQIPAP